MAEEGFDLGGGEVWWDRGLMRGSGWGEVHKCKRTFGRVKCSLSTSQAKVSPGPSFPGLPCHNVLVTQSCLTPLDPHGL